MSLSRSSSSARARATAIFAAAALLITGIALATRGSDDRRNATSSSYAAAAEVTSTSHATRPASSSVKAARRRSKSAYARLGRREALTLARKTFPEQANPTLFSGSKLDGEAKVVAQHGNGMALVKGKNGKNALLVSSHPLEAKNDKGKLAPVDLSLQHTPAGIAPANSAVPFVADPTSPAKVRFTGLGIDMAVAGAPDRSGRRMSARSTEAQVSDGSAFYANVLPDTDAGILPLPYGTELYLIARSEDAPERFALAFDLPSGATLRRTQTDDPIPGIEPQTIEIVKDGKSLAYVSTPIAHDSDGRAVPATMSIEGQDIVLDVPHRNLDVHYPLSIDPEVSSFGSGNTNWSHGWPGWKWTQIKAHNPDGLYGYAINNPGYYAGGLYQAIPKNQGSYDNNQAYFYFKPPPKTAIAHTVFGGFAHNPMAAPTTFGTTHAFWGIQNPGRTAWDRGTAKKVTVVPTGQQYTVTTAYPVTTPGGLATLSSPDSYYGQHYDMTDTDIPTTTTASTEQNNAIFGMLTKAPSGGVSYTGTGTGYAASTTMAWAQVYIRDTYDPDWTGTAPASSDVWTNDANAAHSRILRATDEGLGLFQLKLTGAKSIENLPASVGTVAHDTPTKTHTITAACAGVAPEPICPLDWSSTAISYTLDEGITQLTATITDMAGNAPDTQRTWTQRIDRTPPIIDHLSGSLVDAEDSRVNDPTLSVSVAAHDGELTDPRSGVGRAELLVDGEVTSGVNADCSGGQCPRAVDVPLTLNTSALPEGGHTIAIRMTDSVGNSDTSDAWTINLVRTDGIDDWLDSLRTYVDGLSVLPLLGEPTAPPADYKSPDACFTGTGVLRACYRRLVDWQQDMDAWLALNLVSGTNAANLPTMPVYEDAPNPETTELLRGAAALFDLTSDVRADPNANRVATLSFERSASPSEANAVFSATGATGDLHLFGTFMTSDRTYSGGGSGEKDEDDVPVPATPAQQLAHFYGTRFQITADLVADLQADNQEVPGDPETLTALADAQAYHDAISRGDPYVSGFTGVVRERDVLQAIHDNATLLKAVTIPQPYADGTDATGPSMTLEAAVRNFNDAEAAPPATRDTTARAARPGTSYMPSRWRARTRLVGGANRYGHHVKRTQIRLEWKRIGSLNYYRGDKNHKRGFEAQARPPADGTPWSRAWWTQDSWDSDLPGAYRDDLFLDIPPNKNFAVGTGYGRSIRANRRYSIYYDTNAGAFNTVDTGTVLLEGQATRRARHNSAAERGYCAAKRIDSACFFAEATTLVGTYSIGNTWRRFSYP